MVTGKIPLDHGKSRQNAENCGEMRKIAARFTFNALTKKVSGCHMAFSLLKWEKPREKHLKVTKHCTVTSKHTYITFIHPKTSSFKLFSVNLDVNSVGAILAS